MGPNSLFPIRVTVTEATLNGGLVKGQAFRAIFDRDDSELSEGIRRAFTRLGTGECNTKGKPIDIYKDPDTGHLWGISGVRPERCFHLHPFTGA